VSSDSLRAQQGLTDWRKRAKSLSDTATRLQAVRDRLIEELADRQQEVEVLSLRIDKLSKVGELLRALMDKLVLDQVKTIEGVVTKGLHAIFPDLALAFEAEVGTKYNKIAIDFFIKQGIDDVTVRGSPMESFGGGPTSVSSLILRLLSLLRLKRFPFLLLDETLAAVSDEYVDDAGQFLRKLAASTGIDILFVTHKAAFLDHAAHAFQGYEDTDDDGTWSLGLRRIRGHR
jgi:chromosome segregation ATPase